MVAGASAGWELTRRFAAGVQLTLHDGKSTLFVAPAAARKALCAAVLGAPVGDWFRDLGVMQVLGA